MKIAQFILTMSASLLIFSSPLYAQEHTSQTATPEAELSPVKESSAEVLTKEATAEATIINVANTNATGSICAEIVNDFTESNSDITISEADCIPPIQPKEATQESKVEIQQSNEADLDTVIVIAADTGNNKVEGDNAEITTENAEAEVTVANIVNTNLTGENGYFSVINITKDHNGNIILPSKEEILSKTQSASQSDNLNITNTNDLSLQTNVTAVANTGGNTTNGENGSITAGKADVSITIIDKLNTNIIASNFIILDINTFDTWNGSLQNWDGEVERNGNTLRAYSFFEPIHNQTESKDTKISNTNKATVTQNITVAANTGNNTITGDNATMATGDASVKVEMFNLINTTIIGNNWFYMIINIFETLNGDITFKKEYIPEITEDSIIITQNTTDQNRTEREEIEIPETVPAQPVVVATYTAPESNIIEIPQVKSVSSSISPKENIIHPPVKSAAIPSVFMLYMSGITAYILFNKNE